LLLGAEEPLEAGSEGPLWNWMLLEAMTGLVFAYQLMALSCRARSERGNQVFISCLANT
jgi:hypothetical protein